MLAKDTDKAFDDSNWIYEIKWDGYRAIAEVNGNNISLYSRNGNDFAQTYPLVVEALKKIKVPAVIDGEIVVLNEEGFPDFQKIQNYENNTNYPLRYYAFDLLSLNNEELYHLPLIERKKLLQTLLEENDVIKYSDHVTGTGKDFFDVALKQNLEGIMAKKSDSLYYPGRRTNEWLKVKTHKTTEVIIAGYTAPAGSRKYFGSLILGIKDGEVLRHVGQAGTGYNEKLLFEIYSLLQPIKQPGSPFKEKVSISGPVTWVKPQIICEVKFTEWTKDEKLRHPVFLRFRNDKSIKDVDMKNEKPVAHPTKKKKSDTEEGIRIGKVTVKVTHPEKIYFPDDKVTKGMVIEYYQEIADYILPFLKDRPQSLKRNPNGIKDKGFFHKDAGEEAPDYVKSFKVHSESTDKEIDYILCNDKATLAYLNNLGCIELNPWHSTIKKPDKPDYLIIDIDPSEKNNFEQVIESANAFKRVLDKAGAQSFCKTSGASGLHIYVPMAKKYDYEEVKNFAQLLCMIVSEELPEFTTLERNLQKRGNKKIYLDYLQNRRSQTITSVYSLRPKKGATVSMPLDWKEVKPGLTPAQFTIKNSIARIKSQPDMFKGVLGTGTNIPECLKKLAR